MSGLAGTVHFAFSNPTQARDHVRAGKMRVILAGAPNRYPEFNDVPTMKEAGMGEAIVSYRGFVGPPNMPDYAVKKLEAVFKKVMENDRFKKYMENGAQLLAWMSSQEYSKFLEKETDLWRVRLSELDLLK